MTSDALAQTLDGGIKLFDFIVGIIEKSQAKTFSRQNCLRACYLETQNNIALIDAINAAALKNTEADAPAFAALVNNLETHSTALILFISENETSSTDAYSFLRKRAKIASETLDETAQKRLKTLNYETVLDAMFFIVTRITVLQKICSNADALKSLLRSLDLQTRMKNLKERSRLIAGQLKPLL